MTDPLPVFKALGDDTRFAIYQELGNSPAPLSATELAEAYPELVCNLHRGVVEGVLGQSARAGQPAGMVEDFRTLIDRDPCNVTVSVGYPESGS